jgi:hypothetical protein
MKFNEALNEAIHDQKITQGDSDDRFYVWSSNTAVVITNIEKRRVFLNERVTGYARKKEQNHVVFKNCLLLVEYERGECWVTVNPPITADDMLSNSWRVVEP